MRCTELIGISHAALAQRVEAHRALDGQGRPDLILILVIADWRLLGSPLLCHLHAVLLLNTLAGLQRFAELMAYLRKLTNFWK